MLFAILLAAVTAVLPPDPPPNILVVVLDDWGVDRCGAYGEYPDPGRTPRIDALAASGLLFRNAYAQPLCSPARATVYTGRHGFRTGIGEVVDNLQATELSLAEDTILELLSAPDAVFGKWHLSHRIEGPNDHGASHFAGTKKGVAGNYFDWPKVVDGVEVGSTVWAPTDNVDDALAWVGGLANGTTWTVFLNFNSPHAPIHIPPSGLHTYGSLVGQPLETKYRAMVEATDTELGRLLDGLAALDELENTVVFVAGDNGTPAQALDGGQPVGSPWVANHAKGTLYEGGIGVPLIVSGPGVAVGECTALVSLVDLYATLAGIRSKVSRAEDSVSLLPYFSDPGRSSTRAYVYAELFHDLWVDHDQAIRGPRYKLIRRTKPAGTTEEFYDLAADPGEVENLLASPPLCTEEQAAYNALAAALPTAGQ